MNSLKQERKQRSVIKLKTKLYQYQREGVDAAHDFDGRILIADDTGCGKTIQALAWLVEANAFPAVVICPAAVKLNWHKEARIHIGLKAKVLWGTNPTPEQIRAMKKYRLLIINYDILKAWYKHLKVLNPSTVVIDETHLIKNRTAKRTKYALRLCKQADHVLGLGATPLTNNRPVELWPILNVLRPDVFDSFVSFTQRYCAPEMTRWGWLYKGAENLGELNRKLTEHCMIRRRKRDVLDQLPDKSRHVVPMRISNRKEYRRAENDFANWLNDKSKKAGKAKELVKFGYMKELAASLKIDSVIDWIDEFLIESREKLVVFAHHHKMLSALESEFAGECAVVHGKTKDRKSQIEKFCNKKRCRVFIGGITAMGTGVDGLQHEASTLAFVELPWTPGECLQAEGRLDRIGQKGSVQCYYLIAYRTIEERLCELLQRKQEGVEQTLDGTTDEDKLDIMDQLAATMRRE